MIVTPAYRTNYALIEWASLPPSVPRVRPDNVAPYVISDTMDPTMHMVTGEMIDSKSKFREITRSSGCEEVGNEKFPERVREQVSKPGMDIKRAIEELRGR